jgi:hypothetical protein
MQVIEISLELAALPADARRISESTTPPQHRNKRKRVIAPAQLAGSGHYSAISHINGAAFHPGIS